MCEIMKLKGILLFSFQTGTCGDIMRWGVHVSLSSLAAVILPCFAYPGGSESTRESPFSREGPE